MLQRAKGMNIYAVLIRCKEVSYMKKKRLTSFFQAAESHELANACADFRSWTKRCRGTEKHIEVHEDAITE